MQKKYIITEVVDAWPMYRCDREGYLTKYVSPDGFFPPGYETEEGYQAKGSDGIVRWFPKDRFEAMYREVKDMSFGMAIEAMKKGKRVARAGWNGKGIFLYHVPAAAYPPSTEVAKTAFHGENVPYGAYIAMKTAQGNVVPWLASQTDMLADDWMIVE